VGCAAGAGNGVKVLGDVDGFVPDVEGLGFNTPL